MQQKELLGNRKRGQAQRPAGIVAGLDRQICQRGDERLFVRGGEQALSQPPLHVGEEPDLIGGAGGGNYLFQ
jgi:hypothetical protein